MRVSLTAIKDEAPYILEWVAYQRLIGFDEVLVLANDCADGTYEILDALSAHGYCHVIKFEACDHSFPPQMAGYGLAEKSDLLSAPCHLLISDIDEFLQINVGDGTLDALLDAAPAFDMMFVRWRVFGSGGALGYEPGLVTRRFQMASPTRYKRSYFSWPDMAPVDEGTEGENIFDRFVSLRWTRSYKTLFAYEPGDRLSVHIPRVAREATHRIDSGGRADPNQFFSYLRFYGEHTFDDSYRLCQMNHYCNRSVDEYLAKMVRGDGANKVDPRGLDHWKKGECNEVAATGMRRWEHPLQDEVARMSKACGIEDLCAGIEAGRAAWIAERIAGTPGLSALREQMCPLAGARFPASVFLE